MHILLRNQLLSRIKLQTPVWRCSGSPKGSSSFFACSKKIPPALARKFYFWVAIKETLFRLEKNFISSEILIFNILYNFCNHKSSEISDLLSEKEHKITQIN